MAGPGALPRPGPGDAALGEKAHLFWGFGSDLRGAGRGGLFRPRMGFLWRILLDWRRMAGPKDKRPATTGRSTRVRPLDDDGPQEAGFGTKNPTIPREVSLPGGGNSDLDIAFDKTQLVDPAEYREKAKSQTAPVKFNPTRLNAVTPSAPPGEGAPPPAVPTPPGGAAAVPPTPPAPPPAPAEDPAEEFGGPTEFVDASAYGPPANRTRLVPGPPPDDDVAPTVPPTPPPLDMSDETHDDLQHQDATVSWSDAEHGPRTKQQPHWLANAQSIDLKRPSMPAPVGIPVNESSAPHRKGGTSYLVPYMLAGIAVFAVAFVVAYFAGRTGDEDPAPAVDDEDPIARDDPTGDDPPGDDLPQPLDTPPVDLEPPASTKVADGDRIPVRISLVDDISGSGFPKLSETLKRDIGQSLNQHGPFIPGSRIVDKGFETSLWIKSARVNRGNTRSLAKVNCSMAAKPAGDDVAKMFEATGRVTHEGALVEGLRVTEDGADDALEAAEASLVQEAVRACGVELAKALSQHVAGRGDK